MATKGGAKAIGLCDEIGSLEVGNQADLILADLKALNLSPVLEAPMRNIVPNLVYAASGRGVKTVIMAGNVLVQDGVVLTAHEEAVLGEAHAQAEVVACSLDLGVAGIGDHRQRIFCIPIGCDSPRGGIALQQEHRTGDLS